MTSNAYLQAEGWKSLVGPEAAKTIADIVGPILTAPFTPREKMEGAEKILERALAGLGIQHAGIVTASSSDPGPFIDELTADAKRFIALRPHDLLARAIAWRFGTQLDEILDARFGPLLADAAHNGLTKGLRGRLWLELVRRPSTDGRNLDGALGQMTMQVRWSAVTYLAGFQAFKVDAAVPWLRSLIELIRLGNIPIGRLGSGAFLMVVA
ncbi:MAG TPA: hypothetical protein VL500_02660 [Candidatus Eisenbacteria bacterium]|nr:hypothetical protein [Candidatus Eisenbacteria bacterium]